MTPTTAALVAAADQQLPAETIVETWKANRSDPGGIAAALEAATAAAREEQERKAEAEEAERVAALRTATEAAQAAAALSDVQFPAAEVRAIYDETGATYEEGLAALKRTTAALVAAADQQLPAETIVETWKANRSDPGGIAAALEAATAAAREEQERKAEAEEAERVAALRTATEAAQAAAALSDVQFPDDAIRAIYETGETHAAGMAAVELTTVALAAAVAQKLPSKTIINTLNANESDPERIAPALAAATATVAARREEERKEAQAAARREEERKEAQAAARREEERKEAQAAARREKERKEAQAAARREKERKAKPAKPRRPARNYRAVDEHIAHRLRSAGLYRVGTFGAFEYAFRQHKVTDPGVVDEAIDILAGKKTGRDVPAALAQSVKKDLASGTQQIDWAELTQEAPATRAPVPPGQAAKKTKPQAPAPSAPSAAAARGPAAPSTGVALLRRALFRLFIGVFARGRSLFGAPWAGTAFPPAGFRAASPT